MAENSPVKPRTIDYWPAGDTDFTQGIGLHRFSRFGAWKDSKVYKTNEDRGQAFLDDFDSIECADGDYNCEGKDLSKYTVVTTMRTEMGFRTGSLKSLCDWLMLTESLTDWPRSPSS